MSRRTRIVAGAIAVLATASAACTSDKAPGVRTDSVTADIVFGVEAPEADAVTASPVAAPTDATTAIEQPSAGLTSLKVPFQNRIPSRFRDVPIAVSPEQSAASSCPNAPIGDAPPAPAPLNATSPPEAGLYRYKISGSRTFTYTSGAVVVTPVSGFQPRIVQNVKLVGQKDWTFEVIQPSGSGAGSLTTTWSINTDATQRAASPPYVGENPVRVSEPDGGVSLTRETSQDGNGNTSGTFQPATPLTYLQLPVLVGQDFQSVGVDPRGGTRTLQGQPVGRQTVDACGKLVDGWQVDLTITQSGEPERKESIIVSTDRGGMIISQHIVGDSTLQDNTKVHQDLTFSLGQISPSPVPQAPK
jgi:hypothetical protein